MKELAKLFGEILVKHGKELLEKRRRVWAVCLVGISSGILLKIGWLVKWPRLELTAKIACLMSSVALILWFFDFLWLESCKKKEIERMQAEKEIELERVQTEKNIEMERIQAEKEKEIEEILESFSLKELEFLMRFEYESKRITVFYEDPRYLNLMELGVVDPIIGVGDLGISIKMNEGYESQWERIKERFSDKIKESIKSFSDDALDYLASFIDEKINIKKSGYYEIQKMICIFEGKEEIHVKDQYKNYIIDAREELERRRQEEEEKTRQKEFS